MGDSTIDALKRQIADKERIIVEDPSSTRGKLAATSRDRMLEQLSRAESTDVNNPNAYEYHGIDTVTGNQLYLNNITLKYKLSDLPPTTDQAATYKQQNPAAPSTSTTATPTQDAAPAVNEVKLSPKEEEKLNGSQPPAESNPQNVDAPENGLPPGTLSPTKFGPTGNLSNATKFNLTAASGTTDALNTSEEALAELPGTTKYFGVDAADVAVTQTVATPSQITLTPTENPLHLYASYTYNLSIAILTKDDFIVAAESQVYNASNVIVASAGRANADFVRNKNFTQDFYFDKLSLDTIIGMNAQSRNSNAIHTDFTLIEPYGITFLNRLVESAKDLGVKDYTVMPYMLQIDFFGYDDDGIPTKIPNVSKYIPIRILEVKMKISQKGAEYTIQAVPFSHQAFNDVVASTPFKLEVTASTIEQFFLANVNADQMSNKIIEESKTVQENSNRQVELANSQIRVAKYRELLSKDLTMTNDTRMVIASYITSQFQVQEDLMRAISAPANVNSYTGALNAWLTDLESSGKVRYKDTILFDIHPDIAKAKFPDNKTIGIDNRAYSMAGEKQNGLKQGADDNHTPIMQMAISQGTSIIEVISLAIRNSSYIYDQLYDVNTTDKTVKTKFDKFMDEPLKWFKIIPKIKIGEYDDSRNDFSKIITYQVVPYMVYNTKNDEAPQGSPNGVVKHYNYMFTGKNNDILNFDINFDTLYYVMKTANTANASQAEGSKVTPKTDDTSTDLAEKNYTAEQVKKMMNDKINGNPSMRPKIAYTGGSPGTSLNRDAKAEITKEIQKNVLNTRGGDMISVNLKIVGDPDLIKQDDFFYNYEPKAREKNMRVSENGSIIYDSEEVFARITFNSPGDYDDTTGLAMPKTGEYSSNIFSGIYKILRVKNNFSNGKFEQELELVRYPNQPSEGAASATNNTSDSEEQRTGANTLALNPLDPALNSSRIPTGGNIPKFSNTFINEIAPKMSEMADSNMPINLSALKSIATTTASNFMSTNATKIIDVDALNGQIVKGLPGVVTDPTRPFGDVKDVLPQIKKIGL